MSFFVSLIVFFITAGLLFYFSVFLFALKGRTRKIEKYVSYFPSVSIIIPARNEKNNIGRLLDMVVKQDYPTDRYQIIVVDDFSVDGTREIVAERVNSVPNLKLVETRYSTSSYAYKKRAIHEGIVSGTGEIILTLDADCRVGVNWLKTIVSYFRDEIDIVAGNVIVECGNLPGCIEALEFSGIQAIASGLMNAGFPVTCNGGNLAYRRASFESVGGFGDIGNIVSGDDDLLMQKIAGKRPGSAVWALDSDASVYTDSVENFGDFLHKRARWTSKILSYPSKTALFMLVLFYFFFLSLAAGIVFAVAGMISVTFILAGYLFKLSSDMIMTSVGLYGEKRLKLLWLIPFAEIFHVPYIIGIALKGCFGTLKWHDRKSGATIKASKRV